MSAPNGDPLLRNCSTCRSRERRPGQRTCAECHAAYQKNYRGSALRRLEERCFKRGWEAFRGAAIDRFSTLPRSQMNGIVAAEIVRQI